MFGGGGHPPYYGYDPLREDKKGGTELDKGFLISAAVVLIILLLILYFSLKT